MTTPFLLFSSIGERQVLFLISDQDAGLHQIKDCIMLVFANLYTKHSGKISQFVSRERIK